MSNSSMLERGQEIASSAWLAAEILCTWRWPENSALSSFLPSLCAYAKRSDSPQESLLDDILSILLDGSLIYGADSTKSSVSMWPVPADEIEGIEEPFLRALVSFLSTLFRENIWGTTKASYLIELLANKLFLGEEVNTNCLRILPFLISVLLEPFYGYVEPGKGVEPCSSVERFAQNTMIDWLERALRLPPLVTWTTGQGKYLLFLVNGTQHANSLESCIDIFYQQVWKVQIKLCFVCSRLHLWLVLICNSANSSFHLKTFFNIIFYSKISFAINYV